MADELRRCALCGNERPSCAHGPQKVYLCPDCCARRRIGELAARDVVPLKALVNIPDDYRGKTPLTLLVSDLADMPHIARWIDEQVENVKASHPINWHKTPVVRLVTARGLIQAIAGRLLEAERHFAEAERLSDASEHGPAESARADGFRMLREGARLPWPEMLVALPLMEGK